VQTLAKPYPNLTDEEIEMCYYIEMVAKWRWWRMAENLFSLQRDYETKLEIVIKGRLMFLAHTSYIHLS
jgi:hypothetical protein